MSLDGRIAGPDHDLSFPKTLKAKNDYEDFYADVDSLIMGARTRDFMVKHGSWPYGGKPTWIVTHAETLAPLAGAEPVEPFAGDAADLVRLIGERGLRRTWLVGGGDLAGQLLAADLLDELILTVAPALVCAGPALADGEFPTRRFGLPNGRRSARTGCACAMSVSSSRDLSYDAAMSSDQTFADVLAANQAYAHDFRLAGLEPSAARGLAVLTCIDSRIEPLTMLGLGPGDAKILRNAGARVTDDVLRTLVLASYLLGVDRAMVVAHTKCRMGSGDEDDIHAALDEAGGPDTRSLAFLVTDDQEATVREDVQRVRSWPYLTRLRAGGFLYDVDTGRLTQLC